MYIHKSVREPDVEPPEPDGVQHHVDHVEAPRRPVEHEVALRLQNSGAQHTVPPLRHPPQDGLQLRYPRGSGYPSEMITGTQQAKTDSTTLGLATSKPLGQRQKRAVAMSAW